MVLAGGAGPEGLPASLRVLALPLLPHVSRLLPVLPLSFSIVAPLPSCVRVCDTVFGSSERVCKLC